MLEKRLEICKQCPLWKETINGPICNPNKWINPQDGKSSYFPKDGYVKGCGCLLERRVLNNDAKCVANKW